MRQAKLDQLIIAIYEAVEAPNFVELVALTLRDALPISRVGIWCVDELGQIIEVFNTDLSESQKAAYFEYFAPLNPVMPLVLPRCRGGDVPLSSEHVLDRTYARSEFYNDFVRLEDYFYEIGFMVGMGVRGHAIIAMQRPKRRGDFNGEDKKWCHYIKPALERAFRLRRRLAKRADYSSQQDYVRLDAAGNVIAHEGAVVEYLHIEKAINLARGTIFTGSREQARFERFLKIATSYPVDSRTFEFESAEGTFACTVEADMVSSTPSNKQFLIVFQRPNNWETLVSDSIRSKYSLTPREFDILLALIDGMPIVEIAESRLISLHTARTHLKHAMGKVDCSTQIAAAGLLRKDFDSYNVKPPRVSAFNEIKGQR